MVNCRAKIPEQVVGHSTSPFDLHRWKYLGSTLVAEEMIDLIMVSVREMACRSDEDPDGKGRISVSVRKHQGSEMVKRLLQVDVVCRHVSSADLEW